MESFIKVIGVCVISVASILMLAAFSGTLLYLIYDHIHALFPTAAEKGIIAKELGWWDSVCVTWIFTILLKSNSNKNHVSK